MASMICLGGEEVRAATLTGIDLIVSCAQSSPVDPNLFVDGDTITLDCQVSNQGTLSSGQPAMMIAVFSTDADVGSSDIEIATVEDVPTLAGGSSIAVTLSAAPIFTVVGPRKICTKIDVNTSDLDLLEGRIQETDETNNVHCTDVVVLEAKKDLVVEPGSVSVSPGPADPNTFRAGLQLEVSYASLNAGIGAIRRSYINSVHLGTSLAAVLADPNSTKICQTEIVLASLTQLQRGGTAISLTHGLEDPNSSEEDSNSPEICEIPFELPVGGYSLVIVVDSEDKINERAATGPVAAAEANNTFEIPLQIGEPRDPEFRVQHDPALPGDDRVEVTGPASETMRVSVSSARDLAGYELTLSWSPPELLSIGDPALPGGDPGQVTFTALLESGGLTQSCSVTGIDNTAGTLEISCSTTDPGGTGSGADSETVSPLVSIILTPVLPGEGTLSISNLVVRKPSGLAFSSPRVLHGTFVIGGPPDVSLAAPGLPPEAYPNVNFNASFEILNDGFGDAGPPLVTDLVISRDPNQSPILPASDVLRACSLPETSPFPAKSAAGRNLIGCGVLADLRPGIYTGFFQVRDEPDAARRTSGSILFPGRIVTLRKASKGRSEEVHRLPDQPAGQIGEPLGRAKRTKGRTLTSVKSAARNLNWLVRGIRPRRGPGRVELFRLPAGERNRQVALTELRLPGEDRAVLGAADIDGDGDDELILLQRRNKKSGDSLDFRRIDFTVRRPEVCQSAAVTGPLPEGIVAAAGIQFDADASDEIAVLTRDGVLTIHDVAISGSLPPAAPCRPVPTLPESAAAAVLTPVASDPAFSTGDDEVLSLCALDYQLDGVEELGSLHRDRAGVQAMRIYEVPASPGGSAVLLADDPEFGGTRTRRRVRAIACTR